MEFPGDGARTQTRRIHECGGNDFTKLEQLNDLSRRFCSHPVSAAELRNEFEKINANRPKPLWKLLGSVLAACSFALFYSGTIPDAITAGIAAILIWSLQKYLRPVSVSYTHLDVYKRQILYIFDSNREAKGCLCNSVAFPYLLRHIRMRLGSWICDQLSLIHIYPKRQHICRFSPFYCKIIFQKS